MREDFQKLKERIKNTKSELGALESFSHDYNMKATSVGVAAPIVFGINIMLRRHEYHTNRLLYHAERFIEILGNFKFSGNGGKQNEEPILTTWDDDRLYYEFDSFISTSASLFEEPFKKDAQECFKKGIRKKFDEIFPNKETPDSLFWRLIIIRNRIVHPDDASYNEDGDRFIEFASKTGNLVEIKNGFPVRITVNLVDIENSPELKVILKQEVIEKTKTINKNFKKRECSIACRPEKPDFHKIIFKTGKKNTKPKMVVTKGTNLIQSFLSITNDVIDYLTQLHKMFCLSYKDHLGESFPTDRVFFIDAVGKVVGWGKDSSNSAYNSILQSELFGSI